MGRWAQAEGNGTYWIPAWFIPIRCGRFARNGHLAADITLTAKGTQDMSDPDWRSIVTDEKGKSVFVGLEDHNWEWRTVNGLARSTSLEVGEVRQVLSKYGSLVQRSSTGASGEDLYTLKSRFYARKSPWQYFSTPSSSSSTSHGGK